MKDNQLGLLGGVAAGGLVTTLADAITASLIQQPRVQQVRQGQSEWSDGYEAGAAKERASWKDWDDNQRRPALREAVQGLRDAAANIRDLESISQTLSTNLEKERAQCTSLSQTLENERLRNRELQKQLVPIVRQVLEGFRWKMSEQIGAEGKGPFITWWRDLVVNTPFQVSERSEKRNSMALGHRCAPRLLEALTALPVSFPDLLESFCDAPMPMRDPDRRPTAEKLQRGNAFVAAALAVLVWRRYDPLFLLAIERRIAKDPLWASGLSDAEEELVEQLRDSVAIELPPLPWVVRHSPEAEEMVDAQQLVADGNASDWIAKLAALIEADDRQHGWGKLLHKADPNGRVFEAPPSTFDPVLAYPEFLEASPAFLHRIALRDGGGALRYPKLYELAESMQLMPALLPGTFFRTIANLLQFEMGFKPAKGRPEQEDDGGRYLFWDWEWYVILRPSHHRRHPRHDRTQLAFALLMEIGDDEKALKLIEEFGDAKVRTKRYSTPREAGVYFAELVFKQVKEQRWTSYLPG